MCDTFVAVSGATRDKSVIFGKNSDRASNEAQCLEYYPSEKFTKNQSLDCTYIRIPQVLETHGVIVCRPFWMWGAEMGANEKGVVIGNEAVFTKMPHAKKPVLTGMDLLRLALERADSADQAMEVILGLMADWGQGGNCGYDAQDLYYHNSYIIADQTQAWVLETSGPFWAALKVKDTYSISNGLTIEEEFDQSHPDLIDHARQKGWCKKGQTFNFRRAYSDWLFTRFSASGSRQTSSHELLKHEIGNIDIPIGFEILRHHNPKNENPRSHLLMDSICVHGGNGLTRNASTTGSLIAHLSAAENTYWGTGTAGPCTGIFKPIWFKNEVLPDLGPVPTGQYNPETLWWQHEKLHRLVINDYSKLACYRKERNQLESLFLEKAMMPAKNTIAITQQAFSDARRATEDWIARVESIPAKSNFNPIFDHYWKKQNKTAGLKLP